MGLPVGAADARQYNRIKPSTMSPVVVANAITRASSRRRSLVPEQPRPLLDNISQVFPLFGRRILHALWTRATPSHQFP